jgi:hypothetical protein
MSYSRPGVVNSGHKISTIRQSEVPDLEIWHNRTEGQEYLTIEHTGDGDPRIPFAELPKLIAELTRIKNYMGTGNLEVPSYASTNRRR